MITYKELENKIDQQYIQHAYGDVKTPEQRENNAFWNGINTGGIIILVIAIISLFFR